MQHACNDHAVNFLQSPCILTTYTCTTYTVCHSYVCHSLASECQLVRGSNELTPLPQLGSTSSHNTKVNSHLDTQPQQKLCKNANFASLFLQWAYMYILCITKTNFGLFHQEAASMNKNWDPSTWLWVWGHNVALNKQTDKMRILNRLALDFPWDRSSVTKATKV